MAKRSSFDFSTAYGQLILLVFFPICVLAVVGAVLVLRETSHAVRLKQQTMADKLLHRQETLILPLVNEFLTLQNKTIEHQQKPQRNKKNQQNFTKRLNELQQQLQSIFHNAMTDTHVHGMAIINKDGQLLMISGNISQVQMTNYVNIVDRLQKTGLPINVMNGTLYGKKLALPYQQFSTEIEPLWLVVNMDNEPLTIASYQVLLALIITGLLTLLLLLLSLNIYARRWIAPIYDMRLHLQRTNANNLYKPMTIESSGELNLLQQDLVKTLRRLHTSFQELKNHAEQTEDDLRLAFDEMEMQNISIRNARDAAVSASQTKSAFLANISHELRTPLNSIDGFINLLSRHSGLTPEQNLYVQTIRKSSAHLLALVNDVLDFSKIEAGKLVLDRHEFDLYACIYDVVDMLSPLAAEKDLRLAIFFYDDVPRYLVGDTLRVKQVLTNLVNNAIKFTDDGEVIVRVSLDDNHDERIYISVQDTGKGISPEHQKLLFQSFSQGDPSITRQYGGTGLGLVISKQLTQLMGGKIGFYDNISQQKSIETPNHHATIKGSTFWFTLPITLGSNQQHSINTEDFMWELPSVFSAQGYTASNMNDDKMHILIWLQHTASLQVFQGSLRQLPVDITVATSLVGLLEHLKEMGNRWDWVIVDSEAQNDFISLLKQIRLHYAGKLALFGYQISLDTDILSRFQARALYQPLDRRQLYQLLDNDNTIITEQNLPQWHGFTVLAVDDHLPNLLVLEALLAELGIDVVTANSGYDAIEYISLTQTQPEKSVDLIFMDIQMPRMSGREAAEQIRKIENSEKRIPIIALTAHSLSDERDKLLASGIDDYVGKPISQAQLLQILQKWLGKKEQLLQTKVTIENLNLTKKSSNKKFTNLSIEPAENATNIESLVIDWEDALIRAAGKPDLAANLMMMLIDSIDQEKEALYQAWQAHDRQALANIAHRVLGASRYTGVPALRQACQNFEDKCLLNIQHQSPAQFALLAPHFEQLINALDNLKNLDLSPWPHLNYYRLKEQDMTWKMI